MSDSRTQLQVREAVRDVLRGAEQIGLSQSVLARRTGFSAGVLSSWANGNSDIDLWRFIKLCSHLPDEISSHPFEVICKAIRSTDGHGCFDELAAAASDYQAAHLAARSDRSPGGAAIVHCEKPILINLAKRTRAAADAVIAAHSSAEA